MNRRVVITAMGFITSLGSDSETVLRHLRTGQTAFQRTTVDPDVVVCPVNNFELTAITGRCKNRRYLHRGAALSVGAALEAVNQSQLSSQQLSAAGIFMGTGPNLALAKGRTPALWLLNYIANTPAALVSQLAGIHGESLTFQTACTAGLAAVGEAYRKIKHGYLTLALAGAGDSRLNLEGIMAYKKAQALFTGPGQADQTCRPFDEDRSGFISGEGGAFFLLESMSHASTRQAPILAEIKGFGASMDAHTMTAPHPNGTWAETAVRAALSEARLAPPQIDMISAHGTSTPVNDAVEATILRRVFGHKCPPVLALKSWIGHLSAACGAAELALSLICLQNGYWPPIRNLKHPCDSTLNFLQEALDQRVSHLLLQNFGFGGQNCALVIKRG